MRSWKLICGETSAQNAKVKENSGCGSRLPSSFLLGVSSIQFDDLTCLTLATCFFLTLACYILNTFMQNGMSGFYRTLWTDSLSCANFPPRTTFLYPIYFDVLFLSFHLSCNTFSLSL